MDEPEPFYLLGTLYDKDKKYDLAEKYYKLAIGLEIHKAHYMLSQIYSSEGKEKLAKEHLKLGADKGCSECQFHWGMQNIKLENFSIAYNYLLMAKEQGHRDANICFEMVWGSNNVQ